MNHLKITIRQHYSTYGTSMGYWGYFNGKLIWNSYGFWKEQSIENSLKNVADLRFEKATKIKNYVHGN